MDYFWTEGPLWPDEGGKGLGLRRRGLPDHSPGTLPTTHSGTQAITRLDGSEPAREVDGLKREACKRRAPDWEGGALQGRDPASTEGEQDAGQQGISGGRDETEQLTGGVLAETQQGSSRGSASGARRTGRWFPRLKQVGPGRARLGGEGDEGPGLLCLRAGCLGYFRLLFGGSFFAFNLLMNRL